MSGSDAQDELTHLEAFIFDTPVIRYGRRGESIHTWDIHIYKMSRLLLLSRRDWWFTHDNMISNGAGVT